MKHPSLNTGKTGTLLLSVVILVVLGLTAALAQSRRGRAAKEFMRDKLELSQRVLEGLAIEDYDLIVAQGTKLSAMSKEADWRVFENPDYEQQSVIFRRHVDSLVKAAKNKNLDAATLAYVRVTMSCVDCHKLVRGKLVASADGLQPISPAERPRPGRSTGTRRQETSSSRQAERSVPTATCHINTDDE